MTVLHLSRKAGRGISIERVFADVAGAFPPQSRPQRSEAPFHGGANLAAVAANIAWASSLRADVYHVIGAEHYLALGLPPERTVVTVHDCRLLHLKAGVERRILRDLWFTRPLARCARVVAISEFTRRDLVASAGIDARRIEVVHDCISDDFFRARRERERRGKPRVLQLGTSANKNLERHASALAGVDCHLRIVGLLSDAQRRHLGACGIEFSAVAGISDRQLVEEYVNADLLVFASTYEGFGLPVAEAQAVGVPVVTSSTCSMPEVAGAGALCVDPTDVTAISQEVRRLLEDPGLRRELVQAGHENAERFRAARIAREYQRVYTELARG